jgi:cation transport ATPase
MIENTKLSVWDRFFVPGIAEWITASAEKASQLAKAHAHSLADRFLPLMEGGDSIEDYIGTIRSFFNSMMAEADSKIGASVSVHEGKQVIDEAKAEIESLDQKLSEERVNAINFNAARDLMPKHDIDRRSIMAALIAAGLISGGEVVFNAMGFSLFSENMLFSLILALGFWCALHGCAYAIPWLLNRIRSKVGKCAALAAIIAFFFSLFFWLGSLRIDYAHEANVEGLANTSPIGFAVLNLFLFGVSTFLIYYFLPSKEVRRQIRDRAAMDTKIKATEAKIKEMEDRRIDIEKEKNEKLAVVLQRMAYSRHIEKVIQEKFIEVVEVFRNESMLRLRKMAPCLREVPKPLNGFTGDFDPTSNGKGGAA